MELQWNRQQHRHLSQRQQEVMKAHDEEKEDGVKDDHTDLN